MSGRTVLADQDIFLFFVQPAGLLCGVLVGGLLLAILALEQAALMAVLYVNQAGRRIDLVAALRFALADAWPVLRLTARIVRSAHRRGTKVYVWTVDDASTMSAMMGRGVDGLITNRPALAKAVLAQRARMSPAVRLLLELAGILGVTPDIGEL
jgi:glycerophosphoryl diester phosphodiesterase